MPRQQGGFVFFTALIVLVSAISLSAVGLTRSLTESTAAQRFVEKQQAFQQAEAAVDDALATLTANPTLALPYAPSASALNPPALLALGSKSYTITRVGTGIAQISTSGSSDWGISQTIEVVVQMPAAQPFQQAIFGQDLRWLETQFLRFIDKLE